MSGGGGGRRPPPRSRRRGGSYGQNRDSRDFPFAEDIGSRQLELDGKTLTIGLKSNDQGYFIKIIEIQGTSQRGRVLMSAEKAREFRSILNEFVAEYERLPEEESVSGSERLKTESFSQGRRRFYVDLRQNERGRFLKVTMLAGAKTFIAVPGGFIASFRDDLVSLLDEHADKIDAGPVEGAKASPSSRAPPPQSSQPTQENASDSREVRSADKRFFFDVEQNDRGMYIRLSEVVRSGRKGRINVPHGVWTEMASTFSALAKDYPLASGGEESTESVSED